MTLARSAVCALSALVGCALVGSGCGPAEEEARSEDAGRSSDASTRDAGSAVARDSGPIVPGEHPCRTEADGITTLVFVNECGAPLELRGSDLEGATIAPGERACRDIGTATEMLSAKRYWGFLGVDPGAERHTLAELTFNTDFHDFDWYNISHVDAHNLTMRITPLDRPDCDSLVCADPALLAECPAVGRYESPPGELVACVSPDRDDADSEVARHFESCDGAYAWSGDDQRGTDPSPVRACAGEDFEIVFCP